MSLFKRNNNDSFFNTNFEDEFFNHPLISFPSIYPYYYHHPFENLEKQISKAFDKDVFKAVDFSPKINLSEDEKNYYIHADLPGLKKDQVKMELSDNDHVLTISGERETIINNSNDEKEAQDNKEDKNDNKKENKKKIKIIKSIQELNNGVLEVILPKIEAPKTEAKHTIQIHYYF
ncbi:hypothetical protein PIROE2DRAFT_7906 [Piromyces sp. E2]|nr:hypothetical protein PIROE2DRAFT_7906 [Piromyces sp. E2]|eukprot:OUM65180.1 hypothetical protein PIROE2DRAFT_7906 [Piromyces sp. E2]